MVHESGHAIAALMASGQVYNVELFSDTSGTAVTKTKGKFGQFLVSFAGYPFGSAVAYLLFYLITIERTDYVLYVMACFALMNLMFYVRNTYGIFWIISFTALLFIVKFYAGDFAQYIFVMFISGIMLFEAFYSSIELISIARKRAKSAGDAANLARQTGIPTMFWAFLFMAQSLVFIWLTAKLFFDF